MTDSRGFKKLKEEGRTEEISQIASKGGRAAHESGNAHEFDSEEAREAGQKGGQAVKDKYGPEFFQEIGKKGGQARADDLDVLSGELGRMGAAARNRKRGNQ